MTDIFTTPIAVELSLNEYQRKENGARRHPVLPAMNFVKNDQQLNITEDILNEMAANLKGGKLGARRMVTLAHPQGDKLQEAKAVGWMLSESATVSKYKDTVALYVDIEWTNKMETAIEKKEYGYISPVFSNSFADPYEGENIGWTLRFAGVTNDPHWTDQPELWSQFSATCATDNETEKADMKELEQQKEINAELTAENESLKEQIVKLAAEAEAGKEKTIEFSAAVDGANEKLAELTKQNEEMKAKLDDQAFESLLVSMSADGLIQEKHRENEKLMKLARVDPEGFKEMISSFASPKPQTEAVGGSNDINPNEGKSENDIAVELGRAYIAKNPGVRYHEIASRCMAAAKAGEAELTL